MNNITPGRRMLGTLPLIIAIASVCHEANRAFCRTLGDTSQPAWEDAPDWQKQSAIKGVEFHLENPDASPSHSHDCWLKEKQETGWKYGPVKDPEKKEHPCFVPYDQLPREQQLKDHLFKAIVHALNPDTEHVFGEPEEVRISEIPDFKQACDFLRNDIKDVDAEIVGLKTHPSVAKLIPNDCGEVIANLTLAHRHMEDARMRLGKAIQHSESRESIFDIQKDPEKLAGLMYERYCRAVGGKAFNGDPLPGWDEFSKDPAKQKQADGWREAATAAMPVTQ